MAFIDMLVAWVAIFFANLTWVIFGKVLSLIVMLSILVEIYRIHDNKNNKFDISELFIDRLSGKISGSKLRMNLAFFVTSWILVYATLKGSITEWLFAGYITAWVLDRKFSREASRTGIVQNDESRTETNGSEEK